MIESYEAEAKRLVHKFTEVIWNTGCTVSKPMVKEVVYACLDEMSKRLDEISPRELSPHDYGQEEIKLIKHWLFHL